MHVLEPAAEKASDSITGQMPDWLTGRYEDIIDTIKSGKDKTTTLYEYSK